MHPFPFPEEAWFRRLPEALVAASRDTLQIVAITDQARMLLAVPAGLGEECTLHEFLASGDLEAVLEVARAGGRKDLQSRHFRDRNGTLHDSDLSISVLEHEELILIGVHDASARLKLEEQLRQAQKMEALGMLAGGIAHDFNNLLTIISGYSQMVMSSQHMTTERDRTAIEQILKASERAADLTAQLLAFSRRQNVQPRVLELNRVIDQGAAMLRRLIGEDLELQIVKSPDAGRVYADMGQLQQTLMNLAINAREAMPEGGSLLIRTRCTDLEADDLGPEPGVKPGRYAVLEVTDTGTGMDEATRRRIFEPFFTTKGKGTGLGLSTVYSIVRQSGGSIDISTAPGKGTTFCVYLPAVEDAPAEEIAELREASGGHETVLLVEDEEGVRRMVHATLERKGYHVLVAASGPEAIRISREWDGPVDLLVSDVIMPHMNGPELREHLLRDRPCMLVLFISGYPGGTLSKGGTPMSEAAFLQKPFSPAALISTVRNLLDARRDCVESAAR